MKRLPRLLVLLCAVAFLAVPASSALAATKHHKNDTATASHTSTSAASKGAANAVLNDCQSHGQLTKQYSKAQLRAALADMSAATKQYSNCYDVIQSALVRGVKTNGGDSGSSGGSSTTTIIIIVVVVVVLLAAVFGGLALRRRRGGGGGGATGGGGGEAPTRVQPPADV
jgi:ABC-type transport system involved in cytochrome bd biosynthesis fused ATPase/permease subunit